MLLRNARTATPTSSTSRLLRPGLAWPWSGLINRIPMMLHPIRIIIPDRTTSLGVAGGSMLRGNLGTNEFSRLPKEMQRGNGKMKMLLGGAGEFNC